MRQKIGFCTAADGVRIAHAVAGRGPPLVRVGNWLTHLQYDWDSPVWRHWLGAFSADRMLVRFDLRGSGLSDPDPADLSMDAWVRDLEAVVDAVGLERFPVLGLCQGGAIATAFAARYPERVSRLVLYDTYVSGALVEGADRRAAEEAEALGRMIEIGWGRGDTPAFRELFANLLMPEAPPELPKWLADLQRRTASPGTARRLWNAFHRIQIAEAAPQVQAPTLIFHVTGDAMVPFEQGRRLASLIPGARFVALDGHNHILLPQEPAWQRFITEAQEFLAEGEPTALEAGFTDLTARERLVLDLIARGLANTEIAETLFLTPKTVRNYVSRIFAKLNVQHRAQAIVLAREAGLGRRPE